MIIRCCLVNRIDALARPLENEVVERRSLVFANRREALAITTLRPKRESP